MHHLTLFHCQPSYIGAMRTDALKSVNVRQRPAFSRRHCAAPSGANRLETPVWCGFSVGGAGQAGLVASSRYHRLLIAPNSMMSGFFFVARNFCMIL